MKKTYLIFSIGVAAISVMFIIFLATGFWERFFNPKTEEYHGTMIITPRETNPFFSSSLAGDITRDEALSTRVPMQDSEMVIAVLNREREEGMTEEQFVAYVNNSSLSSDRRIYIAYIGFDENTRRYRRLWNAPTAATRPETISLFSQDIIGDRNDCIVITGMNNRNEHTLTIFRKGPNQVLDQPFSKIAELQIDGSIIIQETGRSLAYQQGITTGHSYTIAAYGQDNSSSNILDQIETIYSYNLLSDQFEQINISRVPGSQVEQRRLREILSGESGDFENFIHDLWYYVSPQGTINSGQYLYFDPIRREVIFSGDETQQIFHWLNSTPTRYGLYITSQNISISTLRRRIEIELESLDSIKLRVSEDVRLKIEVSESWDGSYRRAGAVNLQGSVTSIRPAIDLIYDSTMGRLQFQNTGEYTISSGNTIRKGRYVFYSIEGQELLELRLEGSDPSESRMVYRTETADNNTLILSRVRLGTSGVQDMFEPPITLTPVS